MNNYLETIWNDIQHGPLFSERGTTHPYYISAPHWIYSSAGIRALYLLCHTLNKKGFKAFITNHPYGAYAQFHPWTTHELQAPMLTEKEAKAHLKQGLCPITLYSEVLSGNPLQAPLVARWVMNFPGLLGGDSQYQQDELCFGYSRELAAMAGYADQVLHLPTIDTRTFHRAKELVPRKGACFFASKYKSVHNGTLHPITEGCFEITRQMPDSPEPRQIAELLRRSEVFYTYENTALATEAVLCGCPAVFIPNPHLQKIIGREELGSDGYAWGTDPRELERARATVTQGAINYLKTQDLFLNQLDKFIAITQNRAKSTPYTKMIAIPSWPVLPLPERTRVGKYLHSVEKGFRPYAHKVRELFNPREPMAVSSRIGEDVEASSRL